ncbi:fibrinogen-related protein 1 precursor [Biomphalaria pfeifferi]|uniref:Fibrinogen-related protein 1 n=1 Tax=Biomphalaria pfeifferi TaxID=112525 RepID=A0AAD8AWS3_BIOPF|nr:fibrinogen-related protein 1 precursor [Biomphalaria pfeifferi]
MNAVIYTVAVFYSSLYTLADASVIKFEAEPKTINPLLTKSLSLRCSVQTKEALSSTVLREGLLKTLNTTLTTKHSITTITASYTTSYSTSRSTSPTPTTISPTTPTTSDRPTTTTTHFKTTTSTAPRATSVLTTTGATATIPSSSSTTTTKTSRSLSQPSSNFSVAQNSTEVSHVTSIVISKVNQLTNQIETIADITPFENATISPAFTGTVLVEGNSMRSPRPGESGYLQVVWPNPDQNQSGEYVCEIFGLDPHNHPVTLRSTLTLTSHETTIQDLVTYISSLEKSLNYFKLPKIQKGTETCTPNAFSSYVPVSFSEEFSRAPTVFMSFTDVRYSSSIDGEFRVTVIGVNETHFAYDCLAAHTVVSFDWLAIEN